MVNITLLRNKIKERDIKMSELAANIGIDKATLYRKFANGESFTIGEAGKIVEILNLTKNESVAIFFGHIVA